MHFIMITDTRSQKADNYFSSIKDQNENESKCASAFAADTTLR